MYGLKTIAFIFSVLVVGLTIRNILLVSRAVKQNDVREAGIRVQKILMGLVTLFFAFLILGGYLGAVVPTFVGWGMLITVVLLPAVF